MAEKQNIAKDALKKSKEAIKLQNEITILTKHSKPVSVLLNRLNEVREKSLEAIEIEEIVIKMLDKDSKYEKKHQNFIDKNVAFIKDTDKFYEQGRKLK